MLTKKNLLSLGGGQDVYLSVQEENELRTSFEHLAFLSKRINLGEKLID